MPKNNLKQIEHNEFGIVDLVKHHRAKKAIITVQPFKKIKVTIPYRVSYKFAIRFLEQHHEWIRHQFEKLKPIENNRTQFDLETKFKTNKRKLVFCVSKEGELKTRLTKSQIKIYCPETINFDDEYIQEYIRHAIEKARRIEAKEYIPERVHFLAQQFGFHYKKVSIRNAKTRWGSCSHDNSLQFSLHVMQLPKELIDYIILHELCHTQIKSHNNKFWQLLDQVSQDAKGFDRKVKSFQIGIY